MASLTLPTLQTALNCAFCLMQSQGRAGPARPLKANRASGGAFAVSASCVSFAPLRPRHLELIQMCIACLEALVMQGGLSLKQSMVQCACSHTAKFEAQIHMTGADSAGSEIVRGFRGSAVCDNSWARLKGSTASCRPHHVDLRIV